MNSSYLTDYKQLGKAVSFPFVIGLAVASPASYSKTFVEYENINLPKYGHFKAFINLCSFVPADINKVNGASPVACHHEVIEAPLWLKQRMEALHAMPPPTLQKVRTQFKASAEARQKSDGKVRA